MEWGITGRDLGRSGAGPVGGWVGQGRVTAEVRERDEDLGHE